MALVEELLVDAQVLLRRYAAKAKQPELLPPLPGVSISTAAAVLRDTLVQIFEKQHGRKYVFDGPKDGSAMRRLVALGLPMQEVISRWQQALLPSPRQCSSIAQFVMRVNDFGSRTSAVKPVSPSDPYA